MKYVILFAGLLSAIGVGIAVLLLGHSSEIALTAAVVVLCAIWWVFEPIPIPATSLIPLAIFPLGGVLTSAQLGACVGHHLVLLMMGGFMLSMAMVVLSFLQGISYQVRFVCKKKTGRLKIRKWVRMVRKNLILDQ